MQQHSAGIELTVRIEPETTFRSAIVDPMPEYPACEGQVAAGLVSGGFSIRFSWGWDHPAMVHAAIARLRDALDRLDIDVDEAIARQKADAVDGGSELDRWGSPVYRAQMADAGRGAQVR